MCTELRAYLFNGKAFPVLSLYCLYHTTKGAHLEVVYFAIYSEWITQKTNKNKKGNPVKSSGMNTRLSQFCTLKQNQLPLACLGVEGERSTQKQCNYSALAQQQRAKRASKAFLWAKWGSLRGKVQPVCKYQCMDFRSSLETQEAKDVCQCQHQSFSAFPLWLNYRTLCITGTLMTVFKICLKMVSLWKLHFWFYV